MKRADFVTPILFNAALESTMWKWKLKLRHHGVDIGAGEAHDDLMFYAVSCQNLVSMIETY